MSPEVTFHRYRLVERLALGAFGALWRAADRVPGKEVALRVVSSSMAPPEARAAFEAEMTRAMAVRHRALARVQEVGRDTDDGVWAASEFVAGDSLESVLAERGPMAPTAALGLFSELAHALAELHSHDVVHGSLSARAVLLQPSKSGRMRPMMIGLGRARLLSLRGKTLTPPEGAYSSPELVTSRQYGAASDIWALGILLYHCVTGRPPFAARTASSFLVDARALHRILDAIDDEAVRGLVEQCLALVPEERPSMAALLRQAEFAGWIEQIDLESPKPAAVASPPEEPATTPIEAPPAPLDAQPAKAAQEARRPALDDLSEEMVDFRPRRRGAKAVLALFVASAALLALFAATGQRRHRPSAAAVVLDEAASSVPAATTVHEPAPPTAASMTSETAPPPASSIVESAQNPQPAVAANAKAAPAKPVDDDNPYE